MQIEANAYFPFARLALFSFPWLQDIFLCVISISTTLYAPPEFYLTIIPLKSFLVSPSLCLLGEFPNLDFFFFNSKPEEFIVTQHDP